MARVFTLNPPAALQRHRNNAIVGASEDEITSHSRLKVFDESMVVDDDDAKCVVCLCDYEVGEELRVLRFFFFFFQRCEHHFHSECVDLWLARNKTCPLCVRNIDEL